MLKKSFLEKMKKNLLKERSDLVKKVYNFDIDSDGDETDEIQGNLIIAINKKLSSRDMEKINKIDVALKKIDNKTYGLCQDCEGDIPEKRLNLNPYFILCRDCAEDHELEEKRGRI